MSVLDDLRHVHAARLSRRASRVLPFDFYHRQQ